MSALSLADRIAVAIRRITSGHGAMRIPAEDTDPDLVLSECQARIEELELQLRTARERQHAADLAAARRALAGACGVCQANVALAVDSQFGGVAP